jgi:hypothetical protein
MYQHRYIVYCRSNGNEPEKQLETDKERYPGSCMCGFICWIHEMWSDFYKNAKLDSKLPKTEEIHDMFDKFIDEKYKR